jgi:hypothetical protein
MTKKTLSILAGAAAFVIQGSTTALADEVRLEAAAHDGALKPAAAAPVVTVTNDNDRDRPIQKGYEKGAQKGKAYQKGAQKGAQKGREVRPRPPRQ